MKKLDKEFEKKLEEEFEQTFDDFTPIEEQPEKREMFHNLLKNNKKTKARVNIIRKTSLAFVSVLLLTVIAFIPFWVKNKNPEIIRYYGDDDVIQVDVTQEFVQTYINENIPNYNFIFEDCDVSSQYAIYDKETNSKLLALHMEATKIDMPFITISINIVVNKKYTYSKHSYYLGDSIIEKKNNVTIYTREQNGNNSYYLFCLLERKTYNTYLRLNSNDTEFLEKFKQN